MAANTSVGVRGDIDTSAVVVIDETEAATDFTAVCVTVSPAGEAGKGGGGVNELIR